MVILIALLMFFVGTVQADQSDVESQARFSDSLLLAETRYEINDQMLGNVRGQGVDAKPPVQPTELGVILWDEGKGNGGNRGGSGHSNGNSLVQIRFGGSLQ